MRRKTLGIFDVIQAIRSFALAATLAVTTRNTVRIHLTFAARDKRRSDRDKPCEQGKDRRSKRHLFHDRNNHGAVGLAISSQDIGQ